MKLQNNKLIIPKGKIENYLLNIHHPEGVFKAMYFIKYGFLPSQPEVLSEAIITHAIINPVEKEMQTEFGTKYIVKGILKTPDNKDIRIVTVWFRNLGEDFVNLVTAYPEK